jgi:hypothetical protein
VGVGPRGAIRHVDNHNLLLRSLDSVCLNTSADEQDKMDEEKYAVKCEQNILKIHVLLRVASKLLVNWLVVRIVIIATVAELV